MWSSLVHNSSSWKARSFRFLICNAPHIKDLDNRCTYPRNMLIVTSALLFVGMVHATGPLSPLYPNIQACVDLPLQYSCENTTTFTNLCCNVVKGGLVLQTQYWDTYTGLERSGQLLPEGSWGIHGLWPDNCDG